ncbi:MAG: acyltransferase, partial [Bdellovibrionales bacterium]|nr:acyltransferase [Bdellovibrionales bacterium]
MTKREYRADIDGLRALAVLGVLIYHLDPAFLSGGFVGVDIFFVISGFLITQLIVSEVQETHQFRFGRFYIRRFRRLFPALLFTLTICLIFSFSILFPIHFERFSGALLHATFSLSNFFFWSESGYFDASSSVKPLLHTWSLSVEEQFYLIWPIFIVTITLRTSRLTVPILVILLGGLSYYCNYLVFGGDGLMLPEYLGTELDERAATAFFLTPFRIFEFAIGGIMTWLLTIGSRSNLLKELLVVGGLASIAYSMIAFSDGTIFPYYNALIPCIGTAMLIHAG